jgi:hypothetical protein
MEIQGRDLILSSGQKKGHPAFPLFNCNWTGLNASRPTSGRNSDYQEKPENH